MMTVLYFKRENLKNVHPRKNLSQATNYFFGLFIPIQGYQKVVRAPSGHLRGVLDAFSDGMDPILKGYRVDRGEGVKITQFSKMAKNDDFWPFLGPKSIKNPQENF